jgi:hypothetical protein
MEEESKNFLIDSSSKEGSYQYITDIYTSNCLIEAVKAKLKNTKIKLYFCKPRIVNGRFQMFHFMWSDGSYDYDFSDLEDQEMKWYRDFLFKGKVRQFEHGFAERYSRYRNGR